MYMHVCVCCLDLAVFQSCGYSLKETQMLKHAFLCLLHIKRYRSILLLAQVGLSPY